MLTEALKNIGLVLLTLVVVHILWLGLLFTVWGMTKDGSIFQSLGGLLVVLLLIRTAQYLYNNQG